MSVSRQEVIYSVLGGGGLLLYVIGRKSLPGHVLGSIFMSTSYFWKSMRRHINSRLRSASWLEPHALQRWRSGYATESAIETSRRGGVCYGIVKVVCQQVSVVVLRSSAVMRYILPTLNLLFQNFFQEKKAVRISEEFLLQLLWRWGLISNQ